MDGTTPNCKGGPGLDRPDRWPDYPALPDLAVYGLDARDVAARCPWAVELVGHDGAPCWAAEDLEALGPGVDQ